MLDKSSDKGQKKAEHCSDCGGSFTPLKPDPDSTSTSAAPGEEGPRCPACEVGSRLSNGRRPQRRGRLNPHSCGLCSKTFISSAHLALHLTSHSKERKFQCGTCGKFFHQASHLMAHKIIHSGDRPFKCPDCGKTFGRASHLKTHRRLHTGEKPFKCTYCGKSFTQKAGLMAHVRVHTGERAYNCEQCGKGFRSVALLLVHKAQECSGEAQPEAAAELTPPPQNTQGATEDLQCGVCCRTFVRSSYIRLHIRLKKGQRPYHCKVCNKTFVKLDTFVAHCERHLRQKKDKGKEAKGKVVKPPQFVPVSRLPPPPPPPPPPPECLQPLSSEVNTRSRSKAKIKTEP